MRGLQGGTYCSGSYQFYLCGSTFMRELYHFEVLPFISSGKSPLEPPTSTKIFIPISAVVFPMRSVVNTDGRLAHTSADAFPYPWIDLVWAIARST